MERYMKVDVLKSPSHENLTEIVRIRKPVLIEGLINDWKALQLWNPGYLKQKIGEDTVLTTRHVRFFSFSIKLILMTRLGFKGKKGSFPLKRKQRLESLLTFGKEKRGKKDRKSFMMNFLATL